MKEGSKLARVDGKAAVMARIGSNAQRAAHCRDKAVWPPAHHQTATPPSQASPRIFPCRSR